MASLMDKLRSMLDLGYGSKAKQGDAPKSDGGEMFQTLSAEFLSCEDVLRKMQLWEQMCKVLPHTLFLAAMNYEGDNLNAPVRDRDLHATTGAKNLFAANEKLIMKGNPGYRLAKKTDDRRMYLRTLISQKTKEEWVPLFTDFGALMPVFGQKFRVTVITFSEAHKMAKAYKGIMINPGKNAIRLSNSDLKKAL